MKKSNWIIYIVAIIVSAFLLWLWYWLSFDHIDAPLDLVLSIIWWALVGLACFGIHRMEKKRRERMRTCYLSETMLYNSEVGTRTLPNRDADTAVDAMRDTIKKLDYGFDIQDPPEDRNGNYLPFAYVVRSKKFEIKQEENKQTGAHERIDWKGEVAVTAHPDGDPIPFDSADELRDVMRKLVANPNLA